MITLRTAATARAALRRHGFVPFSSIVPPPSPLEPTPTPADPPRVSPPSAPDATPNRFQLYQYRICPFCNYAKAVLAYTNTSYDPVEVNPLTKAEIKWSDDYKKVPLAVMATTSTFSPEDSLDQNTMDTTVLKGSAAIVDEVLKHNPPATTGMTFDEFRRSDVSQRWVDFATDDLAPLLYPNLCSTVSDSFRAFDYVNSVPSFTSVQRIMIQYIGSLAMYMAASKIKRKRNIDDVQRALDDALAVLETQGLADSEYLSGADQPCLGDIAVYGVLQGLEGLPVHDRVIGSRTSSVLPEWYQRMARQVHGQK